MVGEIMFWSYKAFEKKYIEKWTVAYFIREKLHTVSMIEFEETLACDYKVVLFKASYMPA